MMFDLKKKRANRTEGKDGDLAKRQARCERGDISSIAVVADTIKSDLKG